VHTTAPVAGTHPCRPNREGDSIGPVKPASRPGHDATTDRPEAVVTVLAVDDQPIFLRAAHQLIADTPGFEQVGEATSGPEALEMAAALDPDLVLLDVRMPGMDGIETARRIVALDVGAVVVLISLEETPELPASLATVGAAVHVRKQDLSTRALREIWTAHGGPRAS
jgi:two-component system, NarL family, invasion response regulator UvrY